MPGERTPGTHWRGFWVDPRAGLDNVKKILYPSGTRACSQSLYRLRYTGSLTYVNCNLLWRYTKFQAPLIFLLICVTHRSQVKCPSTFASASVGVHLWRLFTDNMAKNMSTIFLILSVLLPSFFCFYLSIHTQCFIHLISSFLSFNYLFNLSLLLERSQCEMCL
jgi:hypothetical protein